MKYVVYIEDKMNNDTDSFICDNKTVLNRELNALKVETPNWKITNVCKIVKGEYVSIDFTKHNK